MSVFEHFSHEHPLILKEELKLETDQNEMLCYGCLQPILQGSTAYICSSDDCEDFYLHKTCAQLPRQINNPLHKKHILSLVARPPHHKHSPCYVCKGQRECFTYSCFYGCQFNLCRTCVFDQDRVFHHSGHEHELTLMQREVLLHCDACDTEDKDLSYACTTCDFWMHKSCASCPSSVELGFHEHPLVLAYSVPLMYRTFNQYCEVCEEEVIDNCWLYYCDLCRYFVHLKCATSLEKQSLMEMRMLEADSETDDLVQFPVPTKEALMDLMIDQFSKAVLNVGDENENHTILSSKTSPPQLIIHGGHKQHPLILLEEFESRHKNNKDDETLLLCNACIQPVSVAHPFYGCIGCHFFLHKFCAELPPEFPAGKCPYDPEHPLQLYYNDAFYELICCDFCQKKTNGFFYWCDTCDITLDISCLLLPDKLKHKAHKHPLVLQNADSSEPHMCHACDLFSNYDMVFACETCDDFQIDIECVQFPGSIRHKWDPHPIPLICGKLSYHGVMYCEFCEEEVNPKSWLYHCGECDQSFHIECLHPPYNVKVGGKILVGLHQHALTYVLKRHSDGWRFRCGGCDHDYGFIPGSFICFECAKCDFLLCKACAVPSLLSDKTKNE